MKKRYSSEMVPKAVVHDERLFYNDMILALQTSQSRWYGDFMRTLCAKQEIGRDLQASLMVNIILSFGIVTMAIIVGAPLHSMIFFGLVFGTIAAVAIMRLLRIAGTGR